jgi:hypothetical protein
MPVHGSTHCPTPCLESPANPLYRILTHKHLWGMTPCLALMGTAPLPTFLTPAWQRCTRPRPGQEARSPSTQTHTQGPDGCWSSRKLLAAETGNTTAPHHHLYTAALPLREAVLSPGWTRRGRKDRFRKTALASPTPGKVRRLHLSKGFPKPLPRHEDACTLGHRHINTHTNPDDTGDQGLAAEQPKTQE